MSNTLIRKGRKRLEYSVYYNAGNNGHATKVLLGPRDRWVGEDYRYFIQEYEPSRSERAFSVMARLEGQNKTHMLRYWVTHAVLYGELGWTRAAANHLELWRKTYEYHSRRGEYYIE